MIFVILIVLTILRPNVIAIDCEEEAPRALFKVKLNFIIIFNNVPYSQIPVHLQRDPKGKLHL